MIEFFKGDRYRIKRFRYDSGLKVGDIVEVVRPYVWSDENPSYICNGFECPCCKAQLVLPNGKKSRKHYNIIADLYELEKVDTYVVKDDIIDALTHQSDRRLKSVKGAFNIKATVRTDTEYGTDFSRGLVSVERISVQKNGWNTPLVIGERFTARGILRYNIQEILTDDWREISTRLK